MRKENVILTTTEAAAYLGVRRQAVQDAIKRGRIPARRIGSCVLVTRYDLDAYRSKA